MAVTIPATGTTGTSLPVIATDQVSTEHYQKIKIADGTAGASTVVSAGGGTQATALRVTVASDSTGVLAVTGFFTTASGSITLPSTLTYTANYAVAASTPASGGSTFSNAARISGGSAIITDAIVQTTLGTSPGMQGEIWLFDQAVGTTPSNNTSFAVANADLAHCVGKISFSLESLPNNGFYHAQNLNIGFTCSGSRDLRFMVRVKNGYGGTASEVLSAMLKIIWTN